jgi:manganese-dependent ADP-ribose/CDP-alcohol diphosphatase
MFAALLLLCGCTRLHQPPQTAQLPVFAVLADIQYGDKDTEGARHYRTALHKLEECVGDLAQRDLAYVVQLGDLVEGYEKDLAKSASDFDVVLRVLDRQKAPVYHVLGNHCLRVGEKPLRQRYGLKRCYYDFTVRAAPSWRFVVLDGNDAGYGVVSEKPLAWFRAVLARAAARHEQVICFCHFALLKEAARDHRMAQPEPLLEALDRAGCVVAWFAGHDHAGGYTVRNGVHHVTVTGMVEAPDENAYAFVELHPAHLREIGMGKEPSRPNMNCPSGSRR